MSVAKLRVPRRLVQVLVAGLCLQAVVALAAAFFDEYGDEPSFKVWANHVYEEGIHRAYDSENFRYDWLPLYLYVSKAVGAAYHLSGMAARFGPGSRALTLLLKVPMALLNALTALLVYHLCRRGGTPERRAVTAAAWFLLNPGTVLATAAFGYQDAFHTAIVTAGVVSVLGSRPALAGAFAAAALLTKPQAALYALPIGVCLLRIHRKGVWLRAAALGAGTAVVTLLPFLATGRLTQVARMYADVPRIHQWLTGCAHNVWWLARPVPPFASDRAPLILGLSGLEIGLGVFAAACLVCATRVWRRPQSLPGASAFLAFAFFMVVTEIHENHLYAMFPFLSVAAAGDRAHRRLLGLLSVTFALNLCLTLSLLSTGVPLMLGPVRVSRVNAAANCAVLAWWALRFCRETFGQSGHPGQPLPPGGGPSEKTQASASS